MYKKTFVSTAKRSSFSRLKKSRRVKEMGFLLNICGKKCFLWSTKIFNQGSHFKLVVLLYCANSGATRTTFQFSIPLITNLFLIFFTAKKDIFTFFHFKIPLVSHIFLFFSCNFIFLMFVKMLSYSSRNHF